MSRIADIRKTVTTTVSETVADAKPVIDAAGGVTDLAAEKVREARARALKARTDFDVSTLQTQAVARATKAAEQLQQFPALALNRGLELKGKAEESYKEYAAQAEESYKDLAGKAEESYKGLAARGDKLVKRVQTQKATKDLLAQAQSTVTLGKGAVTTVRKAAADIERTAKATLTTGRNEAAAAADAISESIVDEAKTTTDEVKKSATRTRTSAKRTATTARNSADKAAASAKAAGASAAKTAKASTKATKTAASKLGN